MTTPLYPMFQKRIQDAIEELLTKQIRPWSMLSSGKPMRVTRFDGRPITYGGIGFDGSPQHVFWGRYIEPFLEQLCVSEIAAAVTMARERHVDGKALLHEVEIFLKAGCGNVFKEMAEIEQRLLGHGYPEKVPRRSVDGHIGGMRDFIEVRIKAELVMWKEPLRLEHWLSTHKAIVSFGLAVIGIIVTLIVNFLSGI